MESQCRSYLEPEKAPGSSRCYCVAVALGVAKEQVSRT